MTADRLRRALAGRPVSRLETATLQAPYRTSPGALREAAVLVPVYFHADGAPHVLMTRRRSDLRLHPGQISWPGGRIDPGDADSRAAALREAHEEVGLDPDHVEVVGRLSEALAVLSGFRLTPWVGLVPYPYTYVAHPAEVAGLVELSVADLLAPGAHRIGEAEAFGMMHEVHTFEVAGEQVWGASARILHELLTVWRTA
jgi:8-oxo-dGTP pyrophosphatase MutT (NUDIX family)